MLNDLSDFIAANREHPGLAISFALAVGIIVWGAFAFLHKREGALRSQEVRNAERETKAAERLAAVYKAQLDGAEKQLKELAPQSKATDLAGLLDDLTRKLTATAEAGEALLSNRLVHIAQGADGRSVVLLADKVKRLEAHGFVTRSYARGEQVRVERMGQFPLTFAPTDRRIFLAIEGQASNYAGDTARSILQQVGTLGPGNVCLFDPSVSVEYFE